MQFSVALRPPFPPLPKWQDLPADEQVAGRSFMTGLRSLRTYANELLAAVELFNHTKGLDTGNAPFDLNPSHQWSLIAGRSGAIAIYNYAKAMKGVKAVLGLCPTWNALIDGKKLKPLVNEFEAKFPVWYELRQAIAHEAELWDHPKKLLENEPKGGHFRNSILGDTYITAYKGQEFIYSVNVGSVLVLNDITRRYFDVFAPLDPNYVAQ
jgi:hypothetical protein